MTTTAKTPSLKVHRRSPLAEKADLKTERLTHEALADVDAGRVIDHEAVQAWADSLSTKTRLPAPYA